MFYSDEDPCFAASCSRAEVVALRLIARAEQNSFGLTKKLLGRGFETSVSKAVVSSLLERNLLDDQRYAELWLRSRLSGQKAKSPRELQISLANRGIDLDSSRKALENLLDPETEYALLLKFIEKINFLRPKREFPLKGQLKYEGFSQEVIKKYFEK